VEVVKQQHDLPEMLDLGRSSRESRAS